MFVVSYTFLFLLFGANCWAQTTEAEDDELVTLTTTETPAAVPDTNGPLFTYSTCDDNESSNDTVRLNKVKVRPDPVRLNAELRFSLDVTFDTDIPLDSKIQLKIYKPIELFGNKIDLRIPCMRTFGSCEYSFCSLAELMKDEICKLLPASQPCTCPFTKGRYQVNDANVKIPHLSDTLVRLAVGDYYGEVIMSSGEQQLACAKYTVRVLKKEE